MSAGANTAAFPRVLRTSPYGQCESREICAFESRVADAEAARATTQASLGWSSSAGSEAAASGPHRSHQRGCCSRPNRAGRADTLVAGRAVRHVLNPALVAMPRSREASRARFSAQGKTARHPPLLGVEPVRKRGAARSRSCVGSRPLCDAHNRRSSAVTTTQSTRLLQPWRTSTRMTYERCHVPGGA